MDPVTANITLKGKDGAVTVKATRMFFSPNRCFSFDGSEEEARCFELIAEFLSDKPGLALYGIGRFLTSLLDQLPGLLSNVKCIIDDAPEHGQAGFKGLPVTTPDKLPAEIETVFLCETLAIRLNRMRQKLGAGIEALDPGLLKSIAFDEIPPRAWKPFVDSIYPIDIPDIEFQPGQDLILIDCPSRNMALMPNGLAYVHNALKETGIKFQTVDLDIILYHRFHMYRLFDAPDHIIANNGYEVPEDPWLAEYCEEWTKAKLVDYFQPEIEDIVSKLVKAAPKILALSLQACNLAFAREIVKGVKKALPDTLILVGGYSCYQPSIGRRVFPESDYMIIGEADLVIGPLVKKLAAGERPTNQNGVFSRFDSPDYVFKPGEAPQDLDSLQMIKYDWVKSLDLYRNHNHYRLTPIIASRGCRWSRCNFCAERLFWRHRSPKLVVDEFEWLADNGCDLFMFNESDLNGSVENLLDICDEIIRRKLKIRLSGQLRIHKSIDRSFFDRLKTAGFISLRFGVDAWAENTLRLQKKGYQRQVIAANLKDCHEAGIYTEVNTVIGVPGETDEDIEQTITEIIACKAHIGRVASINPLVLFIGSVYWDEPEKHGIHFRTDKKGLYDKYPSVIPSNLWYSEEPYIDEHVRQDRFKRIVLELQKNGFDLSDYAKKVVEDVKSGKGAEKSARPDADEFQTADVQASSAINNGALQAERKEYDDKRRIVFRFGNEFYGTEDTGQISAATFADGVLATKTTGQFQEYLSIQARVSRYLSRSIEVLRTEGLGAFVDKVGKRLKPTQKEHFVLDSTGVSGLEKNYPIAMHMLNDGFNGYNIIKAGSGFFGIKHGYPFDFEKADTGQTEPGVCFKGKTVKEVEARILASLNK
ncbi:radical SAM protein [bacterium]|nr:MAG: radical SAM protein [bacterium]